MFLRSQRLFGQKSEKNVQKKWFFMVFENFEEGIFEGLRGRNFCKHKYNVKVNFCNIKNKILVKLQKLTEKSSQIAPPKKTPPFFWGGRPYFDEIL